MSEGAESTDAVAGLSLVPELVVTTTASGTITWASPSIPPELGWTRDDLVGTSMYDLFAKEDNRILHLGGLAEVLGGPGVYGPFSVTVRAADGSRSLVELMVRNALDDPDVDALVASIRMARDPEPGLGIGRREAWAAALLQGTPNVIVVVDRHGEIDFAGPSSSRILGWSPGALVGGNLLDLVHPDDVVPSDGPQVRIDLLLGAGPGRSPVVRLLTRGGAWLPVVIERGFAEDLGEDAILLSGRPLDAGESLGALLEEQTRILELIARGEGLDHIMTALDRMAARRLPWGELLVTFVDAFGTDVHFAPRVDRDLARFLVGHAQTRPGAPVDRSHWVEVLEELSPDAPRGVHVTGLETGAGGVAGHVALLSGENRPLESDEADVFRLFVDLASLAIDRHDLLDQLARAALQDELTELPNRRQLLARTGEVLRDPGARCGLMFIDIDRFKLVNDSMGHEAGDALLQEVTRRFLAVIGPHDLVARVGGDEFVVLCPEAADVAAVEAVARRLQTVLSTPVEVGGASIVVAASIGVRHVAGGSDPAEALRDADLAMYEAKRRGRNRVEVYRVDLRDQAVTRLATETALRDAVRLEQMRLHHQPIVRLIDGQMVGVEALLRWDRPGVGPVPPSEIIPLLVDNGLIKPLGRWVISEAVRCVSRWPGLTIGVNLAARQLADPELIDHITEPLERYGVAPERLCLEVTEAELITDVDQVAEVMMRLKALGVGLAIDDFGTGFATLDYLRRFAVADLLKIDGSFVVGVDNPGSNDLAIISAAIGLATDLGFTSVAEGVETERQRVALRALGCELAQGFLFSPPVPASEIDAMMTDGPALLPRTD